MVQALQNRSFLVDHVQVYWILQGDPQYALVPAGWNHEIDVTLLRRDEWRPVVCEGSTKPADIRSFAGEVTAKVTTAAFEEH